MLPTPDEPRPSAVRWTQLSGLLARFEHAVEACARLDSGIRDPDANSHYAQAVWTFDRRMRTLERDLSGALNRLTADRLLTDLAVKQQRDAAALIHLNAQALAWTQPAS